MFNSQARFRQTHRTMSSVFKIKRKLRYSMIQQDKHNGHHSAFLIFKTIYHCNKLHYFTIPCDEKIFTNEATATFS